MYNYLEFEFTELYYGIGLDEDMSPEDFVESLKEAAYMWLDEHGDDAREIYYNEDE